MRERLVALVTLSVVVATVGAAPLSAGAAPVAGAEDARVVSGTAEGTQAAQQCTEGAAEFPLEVEDGTNTTVRIEEEPQRVVTLSPSAAQTVWELGAQDKVVGVSQFASYLDGAEEKANVSTSTFNRFDAEEIVSLEADLVLAPNVVDEAEVDRLRRAGLTVYYFEEARSIEDIRQKTLLTGALVGECEGARETVRWMDENLAAVEAAIEGRESPRAVYVSFGFTAGQNTFINDMIETAGGQNIVAEAGVSGFGPINTELVAERDPQWLILTSEAAPTPSMAPYNSTTAVEQDQILVINPNWLNQPAPRSVVYAVRNMTVAFHGEVYGESDFVSREAAAQTPTPTPTPTASPSPTPSESPTPTPTATPTPTSDDEAQPGFGVAAVVLALLGALALLRRRD